MHARFRPLLLLLVLVPFAGCGAPSGSVAAKPAPLAAGNVNLIFVVSEDLTENGSEDINANTANLTSQGLQRSLLLAPYLQKEVLGNQNATAIYALEPMTHLQTANAYPDMVAIETVQQFALLNQISLPEFPYGPALYTANSFPINASYAPGQTIGGVAAPLIYCESCQGLDYADQNGDNESLIDSIIKYGVPGYYVFSAPWATTLNMMTATNIAHAYQLPLPSGYQGPNSIYAVSIASSGSASLTTYDSNLQPPSTYPVLPPPALGGTPCQAPAFTISATSSHSPVANTNETVYFIRHAEAHPAGSWEDGNYVAAGQWRALDLPNALLGKIKPDQVYSIDPAQAIPAGYSDFSYVRPSLTVEPYAIANNLPYHLAADFEMLDLSIAFQNTDSFFFDNAQFSNHKILVAWEHNSIAFAVNTLLKSYGSGESAPAWSSDDYDSIWTVTIDSAGNLTVDNSLCEGIDTTALRATAPQFRP